MIHFYLYHVCESFLFHTVHGRVRKTANIFCSTSSPFHVNYVCRLRGGGRRHIDRQSVTMCSKFGRTFNSKKTVSHIEITAQIWPYRFLTCNLSTYYEYLMTKIHASILAYVGIPKCKLKLSFSLKVFIGQFNGLARNIIAKFGKMFGETFWLQWEMNEFFDCLTNSDATNPSVSFFHCLDGCWSTPSIYDAWSFRSFIHHTMWTTWILATILFYVKTLICTQYTGTTSHIETFIHIFIYPYTLMAIAFNDDKA